MGNAALGEKVSEFDALSVILRCAPLRASKDDGPAGGRFILRGSLRSHLRMTDHNRYTVSFSRHAMPEVCWNSYALLQFRGRRECRMRAAPAVSCAVCTESARMSIQGSGEHPTFPAQWLYGL